MRSPSTLLVVWLAVLLGLGGTANEARAGFIPFPDPPAIGAARPMEQDPTGFRHRWFWDLTNAATNPATVPGPSWQIRLGSAGNLATNTGILGLDVAHLPPPPHGKDIPRNPPGAGFLGTVNFGGLGVAFAGAEAKQFSHPQTDKTPAHFDVVALSAFIAGARGEVVATGRHSEARFAEWSYTPLVKGKVDVRASYPVVAGQPNDRPIVSELEVSPVTGTVRGPLTPPPPIKEPRQPTDYSVRLTTNPTTDMTLAFPGFVDDVPGRLTLSAGFDLFAGIGGEILTPLLADASLSPSPLFVGVDLVEWLSFPAPRDLWDEATDTFSITDGRSALLPGFLFSRNPLETTDTGDFRPAAEGDLWSGLVFVAGIVDGRSVPEPGSLALLLIGLAALAMPLRRALGQRAGRR